MLELKVPAEGRILLHSCCAPCSGAILECMVGNGLKPGVFFSNSNISPYSEYEKRREEISRYCNKNGLDFFEDRYDHQDWLCSAALGLENTPERGQRCLECFRYRLFRAAQFALDNGYSVLATSLASSRWKSLEQVDEAGNFAVKKAMEERLSARNNNVTINPSLTWWPQNWRKGGLQPRRNEIILEEGFYNQNFCGCEFSKRG